MNTKLLALLAAWLLAGPMAVHAVTNIDFDGTGAFCHFVDTTPLTNAYAALGVTFAEWMVRVVRSTRSARSIQRGPSKKITTSQNFNNFQLIQRKQSHRRNGDQSNQSIGGTK